MTDKLLTKKGIRKILMILSTGILCYQISMAIPNMLTLSLSSWMYMTFSIAPFAALVAIIAMLSTSGEKLHVPSLKLSVPSVRYLVFICGISVLCGLMTFYLSSNYPIFTITGQIILFGSMSLMFVLGMTKPELGPAVFFAVYPFLMFAEARLFSSAWLGGMISNMPEWLQTTLFRLENINFVLLMFTIGVLCYRVSGGQKVGKTVVDIPISLFLICTLMSVITANDSFEGLRSYFIKWIFPICIYYTALLAVRRNNGIREIKLALVVLLFLSCLLSIQHALLYKQIQLVPGEPTDVWTVIGGQMGPWTIIVAPLAFSFLLCRKEPGYIRAFCFITVILCFVMAILEMQRAVILGCAVILVLTSLLYYHKWRWHLILCATLGMIVFFSFDRLIEVVEVFRPAIAYGNPYAFHRNVDRLYLWESGLDIVRNNPFLGIGPGGFRLLFIGLFLPEVSSHNMYLEVAVESGILASLLFVIILIVPVIRFVLCFVNGKYLAFDHDLRYWVISLVGFCSFLVFSTCWAWGYGAALFCILGVVVGTMRKAENA